MLNKPWGNLPFKDFSFKDRSYSYKNLNILKIGNLRSYGDQALGIKTQQSLTNDRILRFDPKNYLITTEAGILLKDLRYYLNKYNFDIPVVAGTGLITVGGAVSNDIHGKNHHKFGSFGNHVINLILKKNNKFYFCSSKKNNGLFFSAISGIGLVGEITSITLKIIKTTKFHYQVEPIVFYNIEKYFSLSKQSDHYDESVAWFDCFDKNNRGVFFRAKKIKKNLNNKTDYSLNYLLRHNFSLINKASIYIFNKIYFNYHKIFQCKLKTVSFEKFHHPLDRILNWNRIYGSKGFYQFQCVIPKDNALNCIKLILSHIKKNKQGSFLCVLKDFGSIKPVGYLSFPMHGTTIAIDFPNNGSVTKQLINELYEIVIKFNGRIYLAKDAILTSSQFRKCYPEYKKFLKFRDKNIISSMSLRLKI